MVEKGEKKSQRLKGAIVKSSPWVSQILQSCTSLCVGPYISLLYLY